MRFLRGKIYFTKPRYFTEMLIFLMSTCVELAVYSLLVLSQEFRKLNVTFIRLSCSDVLSFFSNIFPIH